MYQALYRKWRPMVFSDVVGQRHVTDTLKKQIESGHLSHAYLFTGTRGTGKTTCAKILAKAANCLNPQGGEPCNICSSCVGINNGSIVEVSEIDAASYTGVDNIRAIRDETVYLPAEVRMRVFIIDECHMLSQGANNALLKTLEEPPAHVLFILATTEIMKVPATILSRCQSFTFRRISPADISVRIREIAAAEGIPLEPEGAELLSNFAEGGLRDAISMLDQCASSITGRIGAEEILRILGRAGTRETLALAAQIGAQDAAKALETLKQMILDGKDASALLGELLSLYRDMLVLQTTGNSLLLSGGYPAAEIRAIPMGKQRLLFATRLIRDVLGRMKWATNPTIDAELCVLTLCEDVLAEGLDGLCARIEKLEQAIASGQFRGAPAPAEPAGRSQSLNNSQTQEKPAERTEERKPPEALAEKRAPELGSAFWPEVLQAAKGQLELSLYSQLANLAPPQLQGDRLRIVASDFSYKLLNKPEVLALLDREASAVLGISIKSVLLTAEKARREQEAKPADAAEDKIEQLIERGKKFNNIIVE